MTYNKNSIIKFLLSGLLLFFLSLIYVILRDTKDVLILHTPGGAPLVALLKFYSFYVKLAFLGLFLLVYRRNNLPQILFVSTEIILALCIIFHFWGFQAANQWIYSGYYLLADIWGAFTITFLFWAFANQIFTIKEAKLGYPFLMFIFPSLGTMLGSACITTLMGKELEEMMGGLGSVLLSASILFTVVIWLIQKNKLAEVPVPSTENPQAMKITTAFKWAYLSLIFVIITSLGLCERLIDVLFRSQLKDQFPSPDTYSAFMGQYSTYIFYSSSLIFLLTFWMIWKFGWLKSALIPPLYVFASTCLLLLYILFPNIQNVFDNLLMSNYSPIFLLIALQSLLFKGFQILFFATKEIAYIPLAVTTKARGKGVVDFLFVGTGAWLGIVLPAFFDLVPMNQYIEIILLIIIGTSILWMISVAYLGKIFKSISVE